MFVENFKRYEDVEAGVEFAKAGPKNLVYFLSFFLLSSCSDVDESKLIHAKEPEAGVVYDSAVRYINSMRYEAGLNSLNTNPNLEISSANHAK